jgi:predicted esterase
MTRADRILSELMEAYGQGDLATVEARASQLGAAHAELRVWTAYIEAGCRALSGEPEAGLRILAAADERGGWWSPTLLADPALASIWPLDHGQIRTRSEERWRAAQASAVVTWDVVDPPARPAAVVISLHGNGPAPPDLFRSLWAQLESCAALLLRSPQLVTCNVYEWRDRKRAVADVQTAARAARDSRGSNVPLVLAGLGAGGRIAIEAVLTGAVEAAGAIAFAPHLEPLDGDATALSGVARNQPRIWLFPGGAGASVTSCTRFAAWARARGFDCTVRHEEGMGHALPLDFRATAGRAIAAILHEDGAGDHSVGRREAPSGD